MSKTKIGKRFVLILCVIVGIVALGAGAVFFFAGKKSISITPENVAVKSISDDYYLTADYNAKYQYRYCLEKQVEGGYFVLGVVDSATNLLNLHDQKFDFIAGENYRFSVSYTTENGAVAGKYSEYVFWQAEAQLKAVDYSTLKYDVEQNSVSWTRVNNAVGYAVKLVDKDANVIEKRTSQNSLSLDGIEAGKYRIFVVATSGNQNVQSSSFGEGKDLVLSFKNHILSAKFDDEMTLTIECSQKVEKVELYTNSMLKATLSAKNVQKVGEKYVYSFDCSYLTDEISGKTVTLKALENGYILESEIFKI